MKNIKILLVFLFVLASVQTNQAQILKKLGKRVENAAENAVLRKSEQKVSRETGKVMDTILDGKKGQKGNKSVGNTKENNTSAERNKNAQGNQNGFGVYSNFTFVPGNKLLFYDDFATDATGDFPANWETGGSGEIVTINGSDTKWFSLVRRSGYIPTLENTLPENYTIEFDLVNNGYGNGKPISKLYMALLSKKAYSMGTGGTSAYIEILLSTSGFNVRNVENFGGEVEVKIGNAIDRNMPEYLNNQVHISIAVNNKRLRMWVNEEKMVDSPNLLQANIGKYFIIEARDILPEKGHFVGISNFRISEASEDLRSLLLKNGKFSTTGIYFETDSWTVKKESFGILLDIANMLRDNDDITLQIVGHTDNRGEEDYNLNLSENRAEAVKQIFVEEFGIREDRLQFMGKGEKEALNDNNTEKGRANNRRVEFIKL